MSRAFRPGQPRPTAVILIAPDERSAEIRIEGQRRVLTGRASKDTRRAALDAATEYAAKVGVPVLIDARDTNGHWRLLATPDGVVQSAEPLGAGAFVPAFPGQDPAQGRLGRWAIIAGSATLALLLVTGLGLASLRLLPDRETAVARESDNTTLEHPAPVGFSDTVVFEQPLAPGTAPGVSRDGEQLVFVDPDEHLALLTADGSREWTHDLPVEGAEVLGTPRFVDYDGEAAVVVETTEELWFWPVHGGAPDIVELGSEDSPQYAGGSVLVRSEDGSFVASEGELVEVEVPDGEGAMLADGGRLLVASADGPWGWAGPEGEVEEVDPRRPDGAGEMIGVVTALREYVLVRWESLGGEDEYLAFHDSESGEAVGGTEIAEGALEDIPHRSGPIGTEVLAYGPAVVDPGNGRSALVEGFEPTVAAGSLVYGELDGASVAVGADGEPTELDEDAQPPVGLLGENAVVVHEGRLYSISPQ